MKTRTVSSSLAHFSDLLMQAVHLLEQQPHAIRKHGARKEHEGYVEVALGPPAPVYTQSKQNAQHKRHAEGLGYRPTWTGPGAHKRLSKRKLLIHPRRSNVIDTHREKGIAEGTPWHLDLDFFACFPASSSVTAHPLTIKTNSHTRIRSIYTKHMQLTYRPLRFIFSSKTVALTSLTRRPYVSKHRAAKRAHDAAMMR